MRIPCAASLFLFAAGLYLPPFLSSFRLPFPLSFCVCAWFCSSVFFVLLSFLLLLFRFCSCCFFMLVPFLLCDCPSSFLSSFPIFLSYLPSSSSSFVVLLPLYHAATFPLCCYVPFVMLLCLLQVASSDLPFLHCKSTREKFLLFLHTAAQNASKFGSMSPH